MAKRARPGTLGERATLTERTIERFRPKPFNWAGANCWRLMAMQARALGHDIPPVPMFRTALGAKRALLATGASSAEEYLDQRFERLPGAAFAWVGDLVLLPGDPDGNSAGLDAVCIADGHGNLFGWYGGDGSGLATMSLVDSNPIGAWRL